MPLAETMMQGAVLIMPQEGKEHGTYCQNANAQCDIGA